MPFFQDSLIDRFYLRLSLRFLVSACFRWERRLLLVRMIMWYVCGMGDPWNGLLFDVRRFGIVGMGFGLGTSWQRIVLGCGMNLVVDEIGLRQIGHFVFTCFTIAFLHAIELHIAISTSWFATVSHIPVLFVTFIIFLIVFAFLIIVNLINFPRQHIPFALNVFLSIITYNFLQIDTIFDHKPDNFLQSFNHKVDLFLLFLRSDSFLLLKFIKMLDFCVKFLLEVRKFVSERIYCLGYHRFEWVGMSWLC